MTARLAVTLGDPAGVGPEIVARLLGDAESAAGCDLTVVGPRWALDRACALQTAPGVPFQAHDVACAGIGQPGWGQACADGGAWAMATLEAAAELAEAGTVDAIVTAPLSKANVQQAGFTNFVGHTEFFGERVGVPEPTMFFWSPDLCVTLVTIHCALREVSGRLSADRIRVSATRTATALKALGVERPRLGVCGLNPHAGEDGLFGTEDRDVVAPAVQRLRANGMDAAGPLPADTAFMRAGRGDFDAVIAMYHDQGLAPFKLVAFDTGVNVTLGLPYVRTSVDHGTAFDIAGQGTADPSSLASAVRLAARLVHAGTAAR